MQAAATQDVSRLMLVAWTDLLPCLAISVLTHPWHERFAFQDSLVCPMAIKCILCPANFMMGSARARCTKSKGL